MRRSIGSVYRAAGLAVSIALALGPRVHAAPPAPYLVRDILTEPTTHQPMYPLALLDFTQLDDALLFPAWDGIHGWELWRTDGTPEGTALVADVCPGDCSSIPWELRALLGKVYFLAWDGDHGWAVWRTDGTASGTVLVADVEAGQEGGWQAAFFTEYEGALYFVADDGVHGRELWRTDGEPGGVSELVADLQPGSEGADPASLYVVGDTLFFVADDGVVGLELWKSDGTAQGTELVADLCPGAAGCFWHEQVAPPAGPWIFASVGERLILQTQTEDYEEQQLWVSDGTVAGTQALGQFESFRGLFPFRTPDGAVLFSAAVACCTTKLWRTDGTVAGTLPVGDTPADDRGVGATATDIYFVGDAPDDDGWALWLTNGTERGTMLVLDPAPGSALGAIPSFFPFVPRPGEGSVVFFPADDGKAGIELWRSDGRPEGTLLLEDINPGPANAFDPWYFPNPAAELEGRLVFYAFTPEYRYHLWSTDGSPGGTLLLHEIDLQLSAMERVTEWPLFEPEIAATDDFALFLADDGEHGRELWGTDGTAAGTHLVKDLCGAGCPEYPEPATQLAAVGDQVFLAADDAQLGRTLWVSDGTSEGTHPVDPSLAPGYPYWLTDWSPSPGLERLAFADHGQVYVTDGTAAGTYELTSVEPDTAYVSGLAPAGSQLFFSLSDELWVSAGEPADAHLVLDLQPGEGAPEPQPLATLGERLVFAADDGITGLEPWVSDGSELGTHRLLDVRPGPEGSLGNHYLDRGLAAGGVVYFPADDGESGEELWRTDGTVEGTERVADLHPGPAPSNPRPWAAWGDRLYFSAWDAAHGRELWVTKGAGTELVIDLAPGSASGLSDRLFGQFFIAHQRRRPVVWRDRLYFSGTDGTSGVELWSTDGTATGTHRAADLHPGPGSSSPATLTPFGTQLLFSATDGATGYEIWALGEATPGPLFADGFESGDTSAWSEVASD